VNEEPERREGGGTEESGVSDDAPQGGVGGQEGEGEGAENLSPEIGEDGEPGQTQVDAPDDDANVSEEDADA
jgi:hypothetical protein